MNAVKIKAARAHPVEVVVAAMAAVLLVTLVVYLTYRGLEDRGGSAKLSATIERVEAIPAGFVAHIVVKNSGEKTAGAVSVKGMTDADSRLIEFDYIPAGSFRRGAMQFKENPRQLEIDVLGFSEP